MSVIETLLDEMRDYLGCEPSNRKLCMSRDYFDCTNPPCSYHGNGISASITRSQCFLCRNLIREIKEIEIFPRHEDEVDFYGRQDEN